MTFYITSVLISIIHVAIFSAEQESIRDKYQVLRIYITSEEQLRLMSQLRMDSNEDDLDFWKLPRAVGSFADVMVPHRKSGELLAHLSNVGLPYNVTIPDVEKLMREREGIHPEAEVSSPFKRRIRRGANSVEYDFRQYQSYPKMRTYMRELNRQYPQLTRVETIGYTHERRPIQALKIGKWTGRQKKMIWIDGGMHAREWPTSHTAMFFIDRLVKGYDTDPELKFLVDNLDFLILPLANPDGYEYSRTSMTLMRGPQVRLWRKNRSPEKCKTFYNGRVSKTKCCRGVDLNRNFDFHWGEADSSENPCSEVHAGDYAFSEPESRAIRDMVSRNKRRIGAMITLHNYAQIWAHPWGHERGQYPWDQNEIEDLSKAAVAAIKTQYGTRFRFGSGADTMYPAAGGSDDWSKDTAGIKYVFLLELRPNEYEYDGFILAENQLLPTAKETWEGVKVVAKKVLEREGIHMQDEQTATTTRRPTTRRRFSSGSSSCQDISPYCSSWVEHNPSYCATTRDYMEANCAKSCRYCQ